MNEVATYPPDSLKDFQRLMLNAVRRPLTADESMQPKWNDGRPTQEVASAFIRPNDRMTAFDRLEVYNQQYWWRLTASLQEDFRGLHAVIGDEAFDRLVVAYLEEHPSRSWTLRNLGSQLPSFVEAHPEFVRPHFNLAIDVARMEWARVVAFDDPAWPELDASQLATRAAENKPLALQPYVQLLTVQHPVDKLMLRLKKRDQLMASNTASSAHRKHSRPMTAARLVRPLHLVVHRINFMLYYKRLAPEAMLLLRALQEGKSIEAACSLAFEKSKARPKQQAAKIQEWFSSWMQLGWFCECPPSDDATSA